jgi:dihydrolipoamide dehydrogenase
VTRGRARQRAFDGSVHEEERFEWLLAATGRRPNVDSWVLNTRRCRWTRQGVPVHDRRTGQVGDSPCSSPAM